MSTKLVFELTLKSDYHVGSGHNKGVTADSSLLREANGQPALRGSILGQMLKDAAIDMLKTEIMQSQYPFKCANAGGSKEPEYCGQWHKQGNPCPICFIFGTPTQPRKWEFDSARLAEREPNRSINLTEDWGAASVTRNRVSPLQRRTEPDKLFSEEVGDGRLKFHFEANWIGEGKPEASTIAFLAAAARNWRYLGKSRRRGRGQCSVRLLSAEGFPANQDWMAKFKSTWLDQTWKHEPLPRPKVSHSLATELIAPDWQPVRIRVVARLEEPVLVAKRVLAGNQFASVDMIPGNVLLGALASRVAIRNGLSESAHYTNFVGIFRRGGIRFNHLTLASLNLHNTQELYPAFEPPLDVFRCKKFPTDHPKQQHPDKSFSLIPQDQFIVCGKCQWPDNSMESLKDLHILAAGKLKRFDHKTREEMHIRLNSETQRVEPGILFEYVCLEAGQFLCSEIVCRNEQAWKSLCEMAEIEASDMPFKLKLGKGTRRGYGGVSVVFELIKEDQTESRASLPPLRERLPNTKAPFRLYLNSDAIIRDPWGRFVSQWQPEWLSVALDNLKVSVTRGFAKTRYIDSFYNHLGLPRWRDRGLVAGSAAGVQIEKHSLSEKEIWERLEKIELQGIGLRRNEGFGQTIINHPLYETLDKTGVDINLKMTLPSAFVDEMKIAGNVVEQERAFKERLHSDLKEQINWNTFEKEEFAPVARMLRAEKHLGLEHLMARFESLRKSHAASDELINVLGEPLVKHPNKLPVLREPKDFFVKGEGKPGLNVLFEFLRNLSNKNFTPTELASIIGLLAERVAQAVDRARQKEGRI